MPISELVDDMQLATSFDPAEALSIVDGDRELFGELIGVFRENYPADLASIREALGRQDAEALREAAHGFKGALGALAAAPARAAAFRLEQAARAGDLSDAGTSLEDLERQVQALDAALAGWG